ncbi:RNA polymerase sigma-70 factor, ECF subfamily [Chitinophaga terrae (ex Kim and Jung 2007)]|uniref:RNA polymerase sigma-70 factor, ECF subfamily n=2 Tax=Chitinophaga terrae (ex Kim and Jung 2007) TaxID=408074 RepID=A0A1H3WUF4_9BACT|nr:RNA polymerase sigma-70 factor, ECF subfamily [Chitinophaga terrae (ex Kim and Jung 2007)]
MPGPGANRYRFCGIREKNANLALRLYRRYITFMRDYNAISDAALLPLIKEGEVQAFNELYTRYFRMLYSYAWNILDNEEECSDAVQEIFVWLWENRGTLQVTTTIKGYLMAAVKYRLARIIQTSRRRAAILAANVTLPAVTNIEEDIEAKELKRVITAFSETLPQRAREIFQLSRVQHLSNKEIAAQMGISEKTVENQITIALKKLRSDLNKKMLSFLLL